MARADVNAGLAAALLSGMALMLTGCVTSPPDDGGVKYADVQDPDPDKDPAGPKFCNPTGKAGKALQDCYKFNETLYRQFDDEAKQREPWFEFTPDSWVTSSEVESQYIQVVEQLDEALNRLKDAPAVELSETDAAMFTGRHVSHPGRRPYLVRGLLYYRETGAFAVFERDQAILVRHDSVGNPEAQERRSALVVWLGYQPSHVYVDCLATE